MLSRVSLGRGNSPPARTSSTHIIQGVLGIRFAPLLLYLRHAGFATIFTRFCRFSPIFAQFSVFLAPWPHLPGGTRSRNTDTGGRAPARGGNADPGGLWPPPPRAGPPARSAAAESAGGSRADRGHASPAQSDRRAASPAGAGRGGARPPWRVPPRARGGTDYPEPPERARGGAGGGA